MEFREKYNHIPWKEFAEMRDILIRKYFGVDLGLTWEVVKKDIPKLKEEILKIMEELDKNKNNKYNVFAYGELMKKRDYWS